FDGEPLYESGNVTLAENKDWDTMNFDYGRPEVQSFLISSACFWLEQFHLDGLRIDAVANMLYLDYGKKQGEWQANKYGGRENLEAVDFLRKLNTAVFREIPQALMIAEESTSWPMVSGPADKGGLGFNYKWNMGWMNDMLRYMAMDPLFRKGSQDLITFSLYYAFAENFILPLSHDEVVHGKHSLLDKMPGDYWKKFAGLRAFFGYWMSHPGKKLLFMGGEFGQFIEWKFDDSLDWHLLDYPSHRQMQQYVKKLNLFYNKHPEFWEIDYNWQGFNWISCDDRDNSVISFYRKGKKPEDQTVVICNFTPEVRNNYRIGVEEAGSYKEIFNSDNAEFGGSGVANAKPVKSEASPCHGKEQSIVLTLPPLAVLYLKKQKSRKRKITETKIEDSKSKKKRSLRVVSKKGGR
ncbi:MAG: 1,4-alpha-glucan branching enzyme, partial [Acidaminococcaceae bacterium]|nr:1,4-alpha-glucan branching enzyme [Acidaminococcaceae bacterium]